MPLPFRVVTPVQTYNLVFWDSLQQQAFSYIVQGQPSSVSYDPDTWILDTRVNVPFFLPDIQVILTPDSTTLVIPPSGGQVLFQVQLKNNTASPKTEDVWTGVVLPGGSPYGPILLRQGITIGAGATITRNLGQTVPAGAPAGEYYYFMLAGDYSDSLTIAADAFNFVKQ
jgi:hypothetical protein